MRKDPKGVPDGVLGGVQGQGEVATGRVLSRHTGYDANLTRAIVQACATACRDECERHAAMHEDCRVCAEACRRCEQACQQLLAALG